MRRFRPRSHTTALALAIAATAFLVTGCGDDTTSSEGATDAGGRRARLVVATQTSAANQALLEASGAFEDAAYDIEWAYFDGANSAIEGLNAGRVDVSYALASTSVVLAQGNAQKPWTEDDAPFKIVAAQVSDEFSGSALIVPEEGDITSVNDLAGRRIGFAKGSFHHFFVVTALEEAGVSIDDVELVTMPIAEARPAYQSGALDALVTGTTSAHPFIEDGSSRILTTSEEVLPFYSLVVAHRDVLGDAAKSEAVRDLLERLERVEAWKRAHPEEVIGVFQEVEMRSRSDAEFSARLSPSSMVPVDEAFVSTQRRQAEVFASAGVIPAGLDPSVAVDDRFDR